MRPGRGVWIVLCGLAGLVLGGCAAVSSPVKENQHCRHRNQEAACELDPIQAERSAGQEQAKNNAWDSPKPHLVIPEPELLPPGPDTGITLAAHQSGSSSEPALLPEGPSEERRAVNADRATSSQENDDAESDRADRIRALLESADQAIGRGDVKSALAEVRRAGQYNPDDPQIPISAAAVLLRHNQPEGAVRLLAESAQRFPNCPAIHRMLGTAHYRLGDYQRAQVAFQQALSLDKSSALSYFLMGCTLAKLGQKGAAEAHLRQAAMLDPRYGVER